MKEMPVSVGRRALFQVFISFVGLPEFPVGNIALAIVIISSRNHRTVCF